MTEHAQSTRYFWYLVAWLGFEALVIWDGLRQ
jgi:hypothetical protein